MSLWSDLETMAGRCKHSDEPPDADEVRRLCRAAQAAVVLLSEFRHAPEWMSYRTGNGGRLRVTINTDDAAQFMADLTAACDGYADD